MPNDTKHNWMPLLIVLGILCVLLMVIVKLYPKHSTTESKFTPEQREVLIQLRSAQAQLDQTKTDIANMLENAKLMAAEINTNNYQAKWCIITMGDGKTPMVVDGDTHNPVNWGFRSDGVVIWK